MGFPYVEVDRSVKGQTRVNVVDATPTGRIKRQRLTLRQLAELAESATGAMSNLVATGELAMMEED